MIYLFSKYNLHIWFEWKQRRSKMANGFCSGAVPFCCSISRLDLQFCEHFAISQHAFKMGIQHAFKMGSFSVKWWNISFSQQLWHAKQGKYFIALMIYWGVRGWAIIMDVTFTIKLKVSGIKSCKFTQIIFSGCG